MTGRRLAGLWTAVAAGAVVLGVGSTLALAAVGGAFSRPTALALRCDAPALPGTVVDVTLTDRGAMMGRPDQPEPPGAAVSRWWPGMGMRMGAIAADPERIPAGTVSLRASNVGAWTHELLVLPLPAGRGIGQRPVGDDGKIGETGSLGEASRTCAPGAGDGIAPGATGWTVLRLAPGRYELVCNLPGHYAAGMATELDVTA